MEKNVSEHLIDELELLQKKYSDIEYVNETLEDMVSTNDDYKHGYSSGVWILNRQIEKIIEKYRKKN